MKLSYKLRLGIFIAVGAIGLLIIAKVISQKAESNRTKDLQDVAGQQVHDRFDKVVLDADAGDPRSGPGSYGAEKKTRVSSSRISVPKADSPIEVYDPVADLVEAIYRDDKAAIEAGMKAAAECPVCLDRLQGTLDDSSQGEDLRRYAANVLVKSGTGKGVVAVLRAIVDAHSRGQHRFKDGLMQILADVDSVDAADALAAVLTGEDASYGDLLEMPKDVRYALSKAIRNMSDSRAVGERLVEQYQAAVTPEARERLMDIGHAYASALFAIDANRRGDTGQGTSFAERLSEMEDHRAISGMMLLAREKSMPVEDMAELTYRWYQRMNELRNTRSHELLVEYLTNFGSTAEEKAVAAYALAAEKDSAAAAYALQKARDYEDDPLVREFIEAALSVIKSKS